MSVPLVEIALRTERDIVLARQRTRALAELIGFDANDQVRLATAVSEVARNAVQYAGGGTARFAVEGTERPQRLEVCVADRGPGIAALEDVLEGRYRSRTGLGLGIAGARRLMEEFRIESAAGRGTTVRLGRSLPLRAPLVTPERARDLVDTLARQVPHDPFAEIQRQNQELLGTMEELQRRKAQLEELNQELAETNRGMLALHAELEVRATQLRRANELKARFLSHVSHEFRTPLNAVLALSRLLLDRADGDLTAEQEKQVAFIRKAAEDLTGFVDDLLDLARIEAGRAALRVRTFEVPGLLRTLRGLFKPLVVSPAVRLVFDEEDGLPPMTSDDGKVAQILRNLISNALKFTERGEVRVSAALGEDGRSVEFSVADTGIGIAPEDQGRIFDEYGQIDGPVQRRTRGTGLGLPLSRHLATLLGGELTVASEPGRGSTFRATLPLVHGGTGSGDGADVPCLGTVLVVDDEEVFRYVLKEALAGTAATLLEAEGGVEGLRLARERRPDLVFLDLTMPDLSGFDVLRELREDERTRHLPLVVVTSRALADEEQLLLRERRASLLPKGAVSRGSVLSAARAALSPPAPRPRTVEAQS